MSPISIRICVQCLVAVRRSCREKRGYRHTGSWHEWVQDNFYGGSATKRIVIKEPSLRYHATLQYTINTILLPKVLYTYKHSQESRECKIVSAYIISLHLRPSIVSIIDPLHRAYVTNVLQITYPTINSQVVCSFWLIYYFGTLCSHVARYPIWISHMICCASNII